MKYMGDSNWWNERFKVRKLNIMDHEKILEEDVKCFPQKGKILDVACGDGRNSIYLARLGYEVLAIDFSKEALTRLNYFIKSECFKIETKLIDLSMNNVFSNLDKFDVIIINHYRLNPKLYTDLMNHINTGGVLWVNGFREVPNDNLSITQSDILKENDFIALDNYKLEDKKLYDIGERKFIRCIWRKMLLEDIKQRLKLNHLEVKDNNYEDIFNLYKGNKEYAKLSNNYPITMENVKNDVENGPPFIDITRKNFISIYNIYNELIAVLDIIDGYSFQDKNNKNVIWIGLLEIDINKHNTGLGSLIVNTLFDVCKKNSKTILQLGVIKENTKALDFWKKVGFKVFTEKNNGEFDLLLMEKSI